ncbi:MAG: glycosyltransferase family 4 protein, partial [Candidatus Binatia bacterium]
VSASVRQELSTLSFITPSHEPCVIYEGIDETFRRPVLPEEKQRAHMLLGTADPYLLYVGVWMSHKNIHRIIAAFRLLKHSWPRLKLVITGKPVPGYIDATRVIIQGGLQHDVVLPGFVPNEFLPALYAGAACLLFPSLYEGFGLPVLEAAAVGTPVVTSNVTSLPEIMGDAAVYVNPEDVHDIARGVRRVLEDEKLRETLIEHGRQQARKYSWETCARQTLRLYNALA